MFATIMTWIGTMSGVAILLVMACGAFVVDIEDAVGDRDVRAAKASEDLPAPTS